jgi:hypothetical protein
MSTELKEVFEKASRLSEERQKAVIEIVVSFLDDSEEEEAEWDALVKSPQSQRFLDKMVAELKEEEEKEGLLPFPGDK